MKIVIIGGSFAGIRAAQLLNEACPQAEIYLIEKQNEIGFIPSSFHLLLTKQIVDKKQSHWITKERLEETSRINVLTQKSAIGLVENEVLLYNGEKVPFDQLIIATGSAQSFKRLDEAEAQHIYSVKSGTNFTELETVLAQADKVAVVGGGQVGVELAEDLTTLGKKVDLYESRNQILFRYLDEQMTEPILNEMTKSGIQLFLNEQVQVLADKNGAILESEKRKARYDVVLLANHTRPDNRLWAETIKLNDDGTIWVDDYLRTSRKDVYAIGDAIQVTFRPTQEKMYVSLVNNAIRTAQVVSQTISGKPTKDVGTYRPVGNKWFGHFVGSVGLTESERFFYARKVRKINQEHRVSLTNNEKISLQLLVDQETDQLIGAQLQSKSSVFRLLDLLTIAIEQQWTLQQLEAHELFFQPEYRTPETILTEMSGSSYED